MTGILRINRGLAVLVVLVGAAVTGQVVADTTLRPGWNDMVATAAEHGLILSGRPDPLWNGLRVTDATLTGTPSLPNVATGAVTLHRSIWNLFRLSVALDKPVTLIFPNGRQLDLWSRGFRFVSAGARWHFAGDGVGIALHGGGPDDVTGAETVRGDLRDVAGAWELATEAQDMTLPARGTWPNGRLVERAAVRLRLGAGFDKVALERAAISWNGQAARISFNGMLDDRGLLDGTGMVALGPGWAATLKRAHAVGAIDAGEAEAAIGFLGLLSPDDRSPVSFPVALVGGHVRIGRTTLMSLPPCPVAR